MKRLGWIVLALGLAVPQGLAFADDAHHPEGSAEQSAPAPVQQCAPMIQMMGGMMGQRMAQCMEALPEASRAYMGAMMGMHEPMMEAMQEQDPDVAFVKGMIGHHQAAVDMARAALEFGADEQSRQWAQEIIDAQESEIAAMREWLTQRGQ